MFFVSNTSNSGELFNSQDYNCETLKNDISLSESSSSLSIRTDCHDLNLEHFSGSSLQEASSNEELIVDLTSQTLPDLGCKTDCLTEEAEDGLFSKQLGDQHSSEGYAPENLKNIENDLRTECCNRFTDKVVGEKLENISSGPNNITFDSHSLLQNNVIILQCSAGTTHNSFISPIISLNKALNDEHDSNNLDLGVDKSVAVASVDDDPMCVRILCLESELPLSDESSETDVKNNDPKPANSSERNEQGAISGSVRFKHKDVGILSVIPLNSVVLGNITVLPQNKSPFQFQVLKQDGEIKSVNIVKPLLVTDVTWDVPPKNEKKIYPEYVEDSKPVTGVVLSDSEKPYRCDLCNTTFSRLGNYTRHKKIHTLPSKEDPRFQCEVCDKKFIQRCDLTRHMHVHNGTEPHRCMTCGKGYLRHSDLLTHQRFHNREKPFICPQCTKGFSQKGDLNRHLRSIHLHVKPLTCAYCHKKFAKEATLIRHIQVAH